MHSHPIEIPEISHRWKGWVLVILMLGAVGCSPDPPQASSSVDNGSESSDGGARTTVVPKEKAQKTDGTGQTDGVGQTDGTGQADGTGQQENFRKRPSSSTLPTDDNRLASLSTAEVRRLARTRFDRGLVYDAIQILQTYLQKNPRAVEIHADLAGLQVELGLKEDARKSLQMIVQSGRGGAGELIALANQTRPLVSTTLVKMVQRLQPSDQRPRLANIRMKVVKGQWKEILQNSKLILRQDPGFEPAWIYRTLAAVELQDQQEIQSIAEQIDGIPDSYFYDSRSHLAWARYLREQGQSKIAFSLLVRAAQMDTDNNELLADLIAVARESGFESTASKAAERLALVQSLSQSVERFMSWNRQSQVAAIEIAKQMKALGRNWEAVAWIRLAATLEKEIDPGFQSSLAEFKNILTASTPWQTKPEWLTKISPLESQFDSQQLQRWVKRPSDNQDIDDSTQIGSALPAVASEAALTDQALLRSFRLSNQAKAWGLNHTSRIDGRTDDGSGIWIWQSGVGGVGVIDFDRDGNDDLILTSADGTPLERNSSPNQLFRHLGSEFVSVGGLASLADPGFTQGIAVGDLNADGFQDCYVCNIGGDRLYLNNGDGTFTDRTTSSLVSQSSLVSRSDSLETPWTSSAAIADVNHDGISDLFVVRYCAGEAPYHQACYPEGKTIHRSCQPLSFDAASDQLLIGDGKGRWIDHTEQLGAHEAGRGLGIIVGQLDGMGRNEIFVANDMSANHWWALDEGEATTLNDGDELKFREQAYVRGVAVSGRSMAQASMGIAPGDADGDGRLDLLLTHFAEDHNTLYRQLDRGRFIDASRRLGFEKPSRDMLGFGTVMVDLNHDGQGEYVIANGHIDDFRFGNQQFQMPMQLMVRQSDGQYRVASQVGDDFESERLRRCVVTIDADGDGARDVIVTGVNEPTALLMNKTVLVGESIEVELVGRESARDAVGATVTLERGNWSQVRQRLAGNGYQCSDDPKLTFVIPNKVLQQSKEQPKTLQVQWPSGAIQTVDLDAMSGQRRFVVVEAKSNP